MLSKEHYEAIAVIIARESVNIKPDGTDTSEAKKDVLSNVVYCLANYFEQDNPYFNCDKFIAACSLD